MIMTDATAPSASTNGSRSASPARASWTFLTNHAHVLVCLAEEPDIRGRDIAERVGITERAAQAIIADLAAEGYITRTREGRRNRYEVHPSAPLRHHLEHDTTVGELLVTLGRLTPRATAV
ncbi:MAG: winged helix-turn-helix domain-containing protein [Actinomycetota bacterium]